jgi:hypothetical protein
MQGGQGYPQQHPQAPQQQPFSGFVAQAPVAQQVPQPQMPLAPPSPIETPAPQASPAVEATAGANADADTKKSKKSLLGDTDIFELAVAIQLGLAALGGAWAAYQAGQWGGTAVEDFGKSSTVATRAAKDYNTGITYITKDSQVEVQAKLATMQAILTKDPTAKNVNAAVARYLYAVQMTKPGMEALGLPGDARGQQNMDKIPEAALEKAMNVEFTNDYRDALLSSGTKKFDESDKVFAEGDAASSLSTKFGQVGMFFTTALFFSGTGLVVKHKGKWAFLFLGLTTLVVGIVWLLKLKWYSA